MSTPLLSNTTPLVSTLQQTVRPHQQASTKWSCEKKHLKSVCIYFVGQIHLTSCFSVSVSVRLGGDQQRMIKMSSSRAVAGRPLTPDERERRSCPPAVQSQNNRTEYNRIEQNEISYNIFKQNRIRYCRIQLDRIQQNSKIDIEKDRI